MSIAFVKEDDSKPAEPLPDRIVSSHPNYVTPEGLESIEAALSRLEGERTALGDDGEAETRSKIERDLRYWTARRATAQVLAPQSSDHVQFGSIVTIERNGEKEVWRLVGEDEADPAKGTIPYVAPLARALMSKEEGDILRFGGDKVEIVKIG